MMSRCLRLLVACALVLCASVDLRAQGSTGLIDPTELSRFGLERMWFTHVAVDSARGRVVQIVQHVSSTESVTSFDVVHSAGKYTYRETDMDSFGKVIGVARAKRLAEIKLGDLQAAQVKAQVKEVVIPRISVYALTDSGRIHAIDGETGRTRWKTAVGDPRYPSEGLAANDQYVAAVNGSSLYVLKSSNGDVAWERKTSGVPGAGPALTNTMAYVPMLNGNMEAYPLDNVRATPANFRSQGRAMIQPLFTGSHVAWPTDRGHLYVTLAEENRINFRLEANDTFVARPSFLSPDRIVAASIDGFVYCLLEAKGSLQWRFSTGEPISARPLAVDNTVYAVTTDGSLFAIEGATGREMWNADHMENVLSASKQRLYGMSDTSRLAILDRQTGSVFGSLSTEALNLAYVNQLTDRVLIGTASGMLQCLREQSLEVPLLHVEIKKPEPEKAKRAPAEVKKAEPAQPSTNPFGFPPAPATPDPFGSEGGGAKPAPAEKKPTDDPFGPFGD
jgi:outer membrane protein assembly factor BamB